MTDINNQHQTDNIERIESAEKDIEENRTQVSQVHNAVLAQYTQIINDCAEIAMKAVQDYKETNGLEELRSYLETEFKVWAEGISGRVSATETEIESVNEDLQERFNEITKWFTFNINGLTIGQVDNPYKIIIDNDHLGMFIGETEVLWLDVETGEVYTPNLTVKDRFKALGYLIEEDDDGNVNCDYIGGDA
jgi:archaellum component FlaC